MKDQNDARVLLIVEDDPDAIYLLSEAIDETHLDVNMIVVHSGESLLNYLLRREKYSEEEKYPTPDLIIIGMDNKGNYCKDELIEIKKTDIIKNIPVIVVASSREPELINEIYSIGSSGFIVKPERFQDLCNVILRIGLYWFETVSLPSRKAK